MSLDDSLSTSEMPPDIDRAPHHIRGEICATRPPYREGRLPTAVKVFTVSHESRYLLVQGVPALGTAHDLIKLFATFGRIEEYRILDDYPSEEFLDVYWVKYTRIQSARFAKRKLDDHSFFGGVLHVCYAPEYESVEETHEKLQDRRKVIAAKTSGKDAHSLEQQQFVSGGVTDFSQSNNSKVHDNVTEPDSELSRMSQNVSQENRLQNIVEQKPIDISQLPMQGSFNKGIGQISETVQRYGDTMHSNLQHGILSNYMPHSVTGGMDSGGLYTGYQTAIQHQNYSFQSAAPSWQQFGNFYSIPPGHTANTGLSGISPVTGPASSVTTTGVVRGVEANAMKEWSSVYSLPAPPRHNTPRGASRPVHRHPGVLKVCPRFDHARVPSTHATLPPGYDARLNEQNNENVTITEERKMTGIQTFNKNMSSGDFQPKSTNQSLTQNVSSQKDPSQVVSSVSKTKSQNECPINQSLTLKSNSRTGEIVIREYKKPGAAPMFVPRQLKKNQATEGKVTTSTEQSSDKPTEDSLSAEVRKNALILREEHGPSLPDGLVVRKVDVGDPVSATVKGIRKRIQQFSDQAAPVDCKVKKES